MSWCWPLGEAGYVDGSGSRGIWRHWCCWSSDRRVSWYQAQVRMHWWFLCCFHYTELSHYLVATTSCMKISLSNSSSEYWVIHDAITKYLYALCWFSVASSADKEMKRIVGNQDWNNAPVIRKMYDIFQGTMPSKVGDFLELSCKCTFNWVIRYSITTQPGDTHNLYWY